MNTEPFFLLSPVNHRGTNSLAQTPRQWLLLDLDPTRRVRTSLQRRREVLFIHYLSPIHFQLLSGSRSGEGVSNTPKKKKYPNKYGADSPGFSPLHSYMPPIPHTTWAIKLTTRTPSFLGQEPRYFQLAARFEANPPRRDPRTRNTGASTLHRTNEHPAIFCSDSKEYPRQKKVYSRELYTYNRVGRL